MKIVVIHYHLKTGGVTSVIQRHVKALAGKGNQLLIITGQKPENTWNVPVTVIDEIAYDAFRKHQCNPIETANKIINAITKFWPEGCDLIHVHNPTLAKNKSFLKILTHLQSMGVRLFLQIHDFAEDGRPNVFFPEQYPSNCHYGVINSRDYGYMLAAGLKPKGLHLVPNTVSPLPQPRTELGLDHSLALYPVRAIRRKNIGEAFLISVFLPERMKLAITQPPNSPIDMKVYRKWKNFAASKNLPIIFEAGNKYDFGALLADCFFVLTTSITEGFGFVFLEPWTCDKPVWGRRLGNICTDFQSNGIDLQHMYDSLYVCLEMFDSKSFQQRWKIAYQAALASFKLDLPMAASWEKAFSQVIVGGKIDFGLLDEKAQREVIELVLDSPGFRKKILDDNPFLASAGKFDLPSSIIAKNRRAVI